MLPPDLGKGGKAWGAGAKPASKLMLVGEAHAVVPDEHGGFIAWPTVPRTFVIGHPPTERFYPGMEFVGYGAPPAPLPAGWRYPFFDTHIDWSRHRRKGDGGKEPTEARGRANFGFADGHVADYTPDELADRRTRKSKLVVLWSPIDDHIERLPRF